MGETEAERGSVVLRLGSEEHRLVHGDLIGRLWSAALRVDDARVSEAHAMVSMRGNEMKLLALRGRFLVEGRAATEAALTAGMTLTLAPGLDALVVSVSLPARMMLVWAEGLAPRGIPGVLSLYGGPAPKIRSGWRPDAQGYLWPTGDGWIRSGEPPVVVDDGSEWEVGGVQFGMGLDEVPVGTTPTEREANLSAPLRIIARFDTVHIQREGGSVLMLSGRSARLLSELAVVRQPLSWEGLALTLWGEMDRGQLRRRWDMQLQRMRTKLRAGSVRTNLIQATGNGLIELVLGPHDVVVDET